MIFRLIFLAIISVQSISCFAEADGPDSWQVYGVSSGSILNIRKGPSREFGVKGQLPGNAIDLHNLGCFPEFGVVEWESFDDRERKIALDMRWCRIRFGDITGWVYGRYLEEY